MTITRCCRCRQYVVFTMAGPAAATGQLLLTPVRTLIASASIPAPSIQPITAVAGAAAVSGACGHPSANCTLKVNSYIQPQAKTIATLASLHASTSPRLPLFSRSNFLTSNISASAPLRCSPPPTLSASL